MFITRKNFIYGFALNTALCLTSLSVQAADMTYTVVKEPVLETALVSQDESVLKWVPMSIEAFGYDIREVWRPAVWDGFSYSLAFSR